MYNPSQSALVKPGGGGVTDWPSVSPETVVVVPSESASIVDRPHFAEPVIQSSATAVSDQRQQLVYARMGLLPYSTALFGLSLWVVPYGIARLLRNYASAAVSEAPPSYVYTVNGEIYYGERESVAAYTAAAVWSYALLLLGHMALSLPVWFARAKVRHEFQLPGGAWDDCCVAWWCPNCAIAQMATHVRSYRPGDCSFASPSSVLPAYARGGL